MVTSRAERSALARSSAAAPSRQTHTPLRATARCSGWNAASVVPTALRTRPQLGSSPWMAHLSRLLRATERATVTASSTVAARVAVTAMLFVDPSASSTSCRARSAHTDSTAASRASSPGATPDAPDASSSTVSLVDMQPSESTRSNVVLVARRSTASSRSAGTTASVVRTTSMVASPGASMPAPLAIPPTRKPPAPTASDCLGTESVVMIARAASSAPDTASSGTAASTPASSRSIGRRSPIRPVEQTATSPADSSSAIATHSAVAWVSWKPAGPVQALAPPELRTTASTRPSRTTCCDQTTGAALTRLPVNTAAAACSGPSLTTSATSSSPLDFSPAATPAARNPWAAVTLMARRRSRAGRRSRPGRGPGWRSAAPGRPRP